MKLLFLRTTCIIHHILTFFVLPPHRWLNSLLFIFAFNFTNILSYFLPLICLRQQKLHKGSRLHGKKKPHVLYHCVCIKSLQAQAPLLLAQMAVPWQCSGFSHLSAPLDQSDVRMGTVWGCPQCSPAGPQKPITLNIFILPCVYSHLHVSAQGGQGAGLWPAFSSLLASRASSHRT